MSDVIFKAGAIAVKGEDGARSGRPGSAWAGAQDAVPGRRISRTSRSQTLIVFEASRLYPLKAPAVRPPVKKRCSAA